MAEILDAIDAVESQRGGPQEFFEVNADTAVVNLFVATDRGREVVGYLYSDGELLGPAPPQPVESGFTFGGAAVDFDPTEILGVVIDELDDPDLERFVITAHRDSTIRYEVLVRSKRGGLLAVSLSADGGILAVVPR
jgi:hypothetical protein